MKKYLILSTLIAASFSTPAHAYLPVSAISALNIPVYAIYTTSDAACQTGLKASVPMSATPQTVNIATTPFLGDGTLASPINCVVFVLGNTLTLAWASGTYPGQSYQGFSPMGYNADSVCNQGGTATGAICSGSTLTGGDPAAMSWPVQVQTDLAANGLTSKAIGTTANGGGGATCTSQSNIMVFYASTNSACTDGVPGDPCNNAADEHGGCLPTSSGSHCGFSFTAPAASASYKAIFNPEYMAGGTSNGCSGSINPFVLSLAPK